MNHSYEERLGTDPMLRLIFRMALPAVAAQFVNLLYAIVDRVYIGHIPGIGTDALAGVGVTMSIVILISSFSAIVGAGGAPLAAIALGQGNRERAGKILGNGFVLLLLFTVVTSSLAYLFMEPVLLLTGASEHTLGICGGLSVCLFAGHLVCRAFSGAECFYQYTGQARYSHDFCSDRGGHEYCARSGLYLRAGHGSKGSSTGYYSVSGMQCRMGVALFVFPTGFASAGTPLHETGQRDRSVYAGPGRFAFHHGEYGKPCRVCAER